MTNKEKLFQLLSELKEHDDPRFTYTVSVTRPFMDWLEKSESDDSKEVESFIENTTGKAFLNRADPNNPATGF